MYASRRGIRSRMAEWKLAPSKLSSISNTEPVQGPNAAQPHTEMIRDFLRQEGKTRKEGKKLIELRSVLSLLLTLYFDVLALLHI